MKGKKNQPWDIDDWQQILKAKILRKCMAESKENLCYDNGDESVGFMYAIGHWPHFIAIIYPVKRMRLRGVCLKYGESLNTSMVLLYAKVPSVLLSTVLRETLEVL